MAGWTHPRCGPARGLPLWGLAGATLQQLASRGRAAGAPADRLRCGGTHTPASRAQLTNAIDDLLKSERTGGGAHVEAPAGCWAMHHDHAWLLGCPGKHAPWPEFRVLYWEYWTGSPPVLRH
jgi:hypothetical protein